MNPRRKTFQAAPDQAAFLVMIMMRAAVFVLALAAAPPALAGKRENPLDRLTPAPAGEPIPIVDFFRPPVFMHPQLNPAGTHFGALVSTREGYWDLAAVDLQTTKIERITGGELHDVCAYWWLNDRQLLFSVTHEKLYSSGLFAVELGRFKHSYMLQRFDVIDLIGFPKANPFHVIVWIRHSAKYAAKDGGVLRVDTRRSMTDAGWNYVYGDDGWRADIVHSYARPKGGDPISYDAGRDGELAFAFTSKDGIQTLHRYSGAAWEICPVDLDEITPVGIGDSPAELLALAPAQEGRPRALHRLNTVTGELGELLYQDDEYDLTAVSLYRHPVDGRVIGMRFDRKGPQMVWFDANYHGIQAGLEENFPNDFVQILGSDREEKQFFVSVSSDIRPATYYSVGLGTNTFRPIADVAPWIDPKRMRPMKLLSCTSRDGHALQGYVTLPEGASKENPAPLIVLPHDGPWHRDTWRWDPEVQFLASRGYAVFQPNYRGSTGSAWRFPKEDQWEFRKMHEDVTDCVKTLLRTKLVDGERMAIMGWSFGGYLALCGAAYEPDMYRCAVTLSGVYDWERMIKESRRNVYARGEYGVLRRRLGDPALQREKFDEISPIRAAGRIRIPVFVAHGLEDNVTSAAQSRRLIAELKKHEVPFETKMESGEGHGFQKLENQIELYGALEAFLAKHLAAGGAATGGRRTERDHGPRTTDYGLRTTD